jgi:hypothetical protein
VLISPLLSIIAGLDGYDAVVLALHADPLIGDGDDVIELLATVNRDGYLTPLLLLSLISQHSVGLVLCQGGTGEVGIILKPEIVNATLKIGPVEGKLNQGIIAAVSADYLGAGNGELLGILPFQDGMGCPIGIRA